MTREEAIERIKARFDKWALDNEDTKAIQTLIPDLREDDDERIRKELLEVIKHCYEDGGYALCTDDYKKYSAYLEKQKEQKHPNGCFTCDEYKKGYEAGRLNGFTAGYNKAMKEVEQKEQKPWKVGANAYFIPEQKHAEWSDTNELVFKDICKHLKEEGYNGWIVLLNALRNGEFQPKQEWSEEDDLTIADLINYFEGDSLECSTEEMVQRIKSLRPTWKPGEDEERLINTSISFLKDFADKGYENAVECIDWLKSKLNGNSGK